MKKKLVALTVLLLAVDLVSKWYVMEHLEVGQMIQMIPDFFWITYVKNTGAAWSILEGARGFFIVLSAGVAGVLVYYFNKEQRGLVLSGIALMLTGTLGNLIDRVVYGFVRDMFAFNIFGYDFPVFNVADSCLVIGVMLLALDVLILENRGKHD